MCKEDEEDIQDCLDVVKDVQKLLGIIDILKEYGTGEAWKQAAALKFIEPYCDKTGVKLGKYYWVMVARGYKDEDFLEKVICRRLDRGAWQVFKREYGEWLDGYWKVYMRRIGNG